SWVRSHAFQAEKHRVLTYPDAKGGIAGAVAGLGPLRSVDELKLWHSAGLPDRLPAHTYHIANTLRPDAATHFVLGWLMGGYRMARYRSAGSPATQRAVLVAPPGADFAYAEAAAGASSLARDLINTPANDMGPEQLAAAATDLATRHGAHSSVIVGDDLK